MKKAKRVLALGLALLLAVSVLPGNALVDAAKKKTVKVEKVTLNKSKATLIKGSKMTLKATLNPKNTTQKKLKWSTSNKKVATVNAKGVVQGIKKGTATITVQVKGTSKKATCKVTVKNPIKVQKVTLSPNGASLYEGQSRTLKANLKPANTTQKTLVWSTSNKKVATVTSKGVVRAVKKGTATITVTVKGTSKKATCKITVKAKPVVKVTSLAFSETEKTIGKGDIYQTKVTLKPTNATNKEVTYSSSNPSVATVDSKGKVTGKKIGDTVITATAKDGSKKKATMKLHVTFSELRYVLTCDKDAPISAEMYGPIRGREPVYTSNYTIPYFCYGKNVSVKAEKKIVGSQKVETIRVLEAMPCKLYYGINIDADVTGTVFADAGAKVEVWQGDTKIASYQPQKKEGLNWLISSYTGTTDTFEVYDRIEESMFALREVAYGDLRITGLKESSYIDKVTFEESKITIYTSSEDFYEHPENYLDEIVPICADPKLKTELSVDVDGFVNIEIEGENGEKREYWIVVRMSDYDALTVTKMSTTESGDWKFDLSSASYGVLLIEGTKKEIDLEKIQVECGDLDITYELKDDPDMGPVLVVKHPNGYERTYNIYYSCDVIKAYPHLQVTDITSTDGSITKYTCQSTYLDLYGTKPSLEMDDLLPDILQATIQSEEAEWILERDELDRWTLIVSDSDGNEIKYTIYYTQDTEAVYGDLKVTNVTSASKDFLAAKVGDEDLDIYGKCDFGVYKDQVKVEIAQKGAKYRFEFREDACSWMLVLTGKNGTTREYYVYTYTDLEAAYGELVVTDVTHSMLTKVDIFDQNINLEGEPESMSLMLDELLITIAEEGATYKIELKQSAEDGGTENWLLTLTGKDGTKREYDIYYQQDEDSKYGGLKISDITSTDGSMTRYDAYDSYIEFFGTVDDFSQLKDQLVLTLSDETASYIIEARYVEDEEGVFVWYLDLIRGEEVIRTFWLNYHKDYDTIYGDLQMEGSNIGSQDGSLVECEVYTESIWIKGTHDDFEEMKAQLVFTFDEGKDFQTTFRYDEDLGMWVLVLTGDDEATREYTIDYVVDYGDLEISSWRAADSIDDVMIGSDCIWVYGIRDDFASVKDDLRFSYVGENVTGEFQYVQEQDEWYYVLTDSVTERTRKYRIEYIVSSEE